MTFKKAVRQRVKARIGICGPAGSGKTMSALKLAFGIVGTDGRIAVLDTENESASLYAHLGDYDTDVIKPPFTVDKYINGIREAERNGYDLLIIDSLSHAWAGTGGILEYVDAKADAARGNKFAGWREATPKHNSLVDAMLQSPMHIIATMRSKTEYILVEDEKGKKVPKKVGMAPVQREGMDYECATC
jgi:KaiC/GvpD/RAD55 family RecA-like ATPase